MTVPRIPEQSLAAWITFSQQNTRPTNPGLIFDRFMPEITDDHAKYTGLGQVEKAATHADQELLTSWNGRWDTLARQSRAHTFKMASDWRFVTGLGRKGPLEVGFTFHRYGFPILPGSSVKGVARAWALSAGDQTETAPDFQTIFGHATDSDEAAGRAIFLDAIPAAVPKLELDIMNPHYPKYYQGDEFPSNWQSPVPVRFLTVAPDTVFRFAVGWRGTYDEKLHQQAHAWLKNGLMELGAGAKTSAGYGYFIPEEEAQARRVRVSTRQHYSETPAPTLQAETWGPRQSAKGKVRAKGTRPQIEDETTQARYPVDWHKLNMDALGHGTSVTYEYEESDTGRRRVVAVKRRIGAL